MQGVLFFWVFYTISLAQGHGDTDSQSRPYGVAMALLLLSWYFHIAAEVPLLPQSRPGRVRARPGFFIFRSDDQIGPTSSRQLDESTTISGSRCATSDNVVNAFSMVRKRTGRPS
jgi:hypothetical protein